jgi:hypothetical protein
MIIKKGLKQNLVINTQVTHCQKTGTIHVLDDKKVYTILEIISFHYERRQIGLTIYKNKNKKTLFPPARKHPSGHLHAEIKITVNSMPNNDYKKRD